MTAETRYRSRDGTPSDLAPLGYVPQSGRQGVSDHGKKKAAIANQQPMSPVRNGSSFICALLPACRMYYRIKPKITYSTKLMIAMEMQ